MIGVTRDGHVMTLEMQRAERRNALNGELVDSLREAVEKASAEDIRAIVLTGQGAVFSAGADLTDAARRIADDRAREGSLATDAAEALARLGDEVKALDATIATATAAIPDLDAAQAEAERHARDAEVALAQAMTRQAG